jgi:hypothetical protein
MGMLVPHRIAPSAIHGTGLFAVADLPAGCLLWRYEPGLDCRRCLNHLDPAERQQALHFGYVNPAAPQWVVLCGDDARFWNFPAVGTPANAVPSAELWHGEALIRAARPIACGEELLIDPSSDADYFRKIATALPQLMSHSWLPQVS